MVDCFSIATKVSGISAQEGKLLSSNSTKVTLKVTMDDCISIATVSAQECKVLIVIVTQPRSL